MVTIAAVQRFAGSLPRSEEQLMGGYLKFRVGRLVFASIALDDASMGFGFPKEERAALVAAQPTKYRLPSAGDMRYNWVDVRLDAIDEAEMRRRILDAWRMCVSKRVRDSYRDPV